MIWNMLIFHVIFEWLFVSINFGTNFTTKTYFFFMDSEYMLSKVYIIGKCFATKLTINFFCFDVLGLKMNFQNIFEQISHCALFGHPWVLALCIFRFLSIVNPFLQMLHSKHSSIVLGKKILCIFNITFLRRSGCVEFFLFTKYPLKSVWNWLMGIHFFVFIHYYFQPFQPSFLKI